METATVVTNPATWLPQDDVLLHKAIQEGASLEALAKGAVAFSCPFTLQEVHDRWRALLYNPDVSAQACAHLSIDEVDKNKETNATHRKRKVGSIRKRYYAMLKRIRHDFFSSCDLGFVTESNLPSCTANGGDAFHPENQEEPLVYNQITEAAKSDQLHGFPVSDLPFSAQGCLRIDEVSLFPLNNNGCNYIIPDTLQANYTGSGECGLLGEELSNNNAFNMGFSPPLPSIPLWKTMEDIASQGVSELPVNDDSKGKCTDKQSGETFTNSISVSHCDFVDLPDSLFDFSNSDILLMDVDGSVPIDEYFYDNTLPSLPFDMEAMMDANAVIDAEAGVETPNLGTALGENEPLSHEKSQMSSEITPNNKPLELTEGPLYCALNTEDPDIPCNDDIFLLIHPSAPSTSAMISLTKSAMDPIPIKEKNIEQGLNSVKKSREVVKSSKPLQKFSSYILPEMVQVHTGEPRAVLAESNDMCKDQGSRHKAVPDPTQFEPAAKANMDKDVKGVGSPIVLEELLLNAEIGLLEINSPEPVLSPSTPDQERPESENDDPNFSDIEAMILDMDLGQYDDDSYFSRRVSRYQREYSKRTIMRLEQSTRISIQRAMTSQGALAVLYGRHSRHFIRKTEVLLGRSTEETVVDIDLGKEGRKNKISRRQAILKMEDDGSFAIRNLAKTRILVNGTEVGIGESMGLGSSCLIEIRGICFVFESNQIGIKRFLENAQKRNRGHMANFEWLPMELEARG